MIHVRDMIQRPAQVVTFCDLPAAAIDTDLLAGLRERHACFCATENQEFILPAEPNVAVRVTRG